MTVKPEHAKVFMDQGCLRLERFLPGRAVTAVRQCVRDELKRLASGRGGLASLQALPVFQQIGKLSGLVRVPGLHEALMVPELGDVIHGLGDRMPSSIQPTQLLLSPPTQGTWSLDGLNWHVDVAAEPRDRIPGIQAFFLIDDVAPRGGATLALAGSHHVHARGAEAMSALRRMLKTSSDLEHGLRTRDIRIVEMCGRAGDVYLMDMRLLHTPSINASRQVRMMATSRCLYG